ncbi:MAG: GntR family transcriptional regulator [Spirochaetales bacterium]|nr:GntR family transcriptional regulator [Spirochaetales bacterium]
MDKLKKDSLTELVYTKITDMILNKDLVPGDKLVIKDLANLLGVSQTPVKAAVQRLVHEGVAEQQNSSGTYLKVFSNRDMEHLYAVRAGLESVSLRLCMERFEPKEIEAITSVFDIFQDDKPIDPVQYQQVDRRFHEKILLLSNNPIIIDFIRNFDFVLKCYQLGLLRPPEETLPEHREIIGSIRNGDIDKACRLLMHHHLRTKNALAASGVQERQSPE